MKHLLATLPLLLLFAAVFAQSPFIRVEGTHFVKNGKPYYYLGTNFWYGLNLGSRGQGGDRDRLIRELDRLQGLGVTNLRVMAASEGPDTEPWRMAPALQSGPGEYNADVLDGLDTVKVCVAYEVDGVRHEHLPYHQSELSHARPVYEELPGWQEDLSGATELHDLPPRALAYLDFLEEQVGVPIRLVGVGPGRTQFVQRLP